MRGRLASRSLPASAWATSSSIQGSAKLPPCSSVCAWIARIASSARSASPAATSINARYVRAARSAVASPTSAATVTARASNSAASVMLAERRNPPRPARTRTTPASPGRRAARAADAARRIPARQPCASCWNQATPRSSASERPRRYSSSTAHASSRQRSNSPTASIGSVKQRWLARTSSAVAIAPSSPLACGARRGVGRQLVRAPEVTSAAHDPRPRGERAGPQRRRQAVRVERPLERAGGAVEAAPGAEPELERKARPQRRLGVGRERSIERRLEVGRLGVERGEHLRLAWRQRIPALALGQGHERVAMAVAHRVGLAGVVEPRQGVLAHGLQQPVPHAGAVPVHAHQRVLGERLQAGQDVARRTPRGRTRASCHRRTPPARAAAAGRRRAAARSSSPATRAASGGAHRRRTSAPTGVPAHRRVRARCRSAPTPTRVPRRARAPAVSRPAAGRSQRSPPRPRRRATSGGRPGTRGR